MCVCVYFAHLVFSLPLTLETSVPFIGKRFRVEHVEFGYAYHCSALGILDPSSGQSFSRAVGMKTCVFFMSISV